MVLCKGRALGMAPRRELSQARALGKVLAFQLAQVCVSLRPPNGHTNKLYYYHIKFWKSGCVLYHGLGCMEKLLKLSTDLYSMKSKKSLNHSIVFVGIK